MCVMSKLKWDLMVSGLEIATQHLTVLVMLQDSRGIAGLGSRVYCSEWLDFHNRSSLTILDNSI